MLTLIQFDFAVQRRMPIWRLSCNCLIESCSAMFHSRKQCYKYCFEVSRNQPSAQLDIFLCSFKAIPPFPTPFSDFFFSYYPGQ